MVSLWQAQSSDVFQKLILNKNQAYIGKINEETTIKVILTSVEVISKNPEEYKVKGNTNVKGTICDFEGFITLNAEDTNLYKNQDMKFYTFEFSEAKTHDHTGILSGSFSIKILAEKLSLKVFEGYWKSYNQKMKFPVYFDNSYIIEKSILEPKKK